MFKKSNATKKVLSLLMAIMMVVSVLTPTPLTSGLTRKVQAATHKAGSWAELRDKISGASSGDVIEITQDIVATKAKDKKGNDFTTIDIQGGKTVTIQAEAGKNYTIWRDKDNADFPMFKTSNANAGLILGEGLTLTGMTCGPISAGEFKVVWTNGAETNPQTGEETVTAGTTLAKTPTGWAPEEGYEFKGWKWKTPDGQEGTSVGTETPNSTGFKVPENTYGTMTIVAQWEKPAETGEFKVVFHNGGTGDKANQTNPEVVQVGESIVKNPADIASGWAPESGLVFKGWKFLGPNGNENNTSSNTPNTSTGNWKVPADKYGTMTLVAQWEKSSSGSGNLSYIIGKNEYFFYLQNNNNVKMFTKDGASSTNNLDEVTASIKDGKVYIKKNNTDVQLNCYGGNITLADKSWRDGYPLVAETINGKTYLKEVSTSSNGGKYMYPQGTGQGGFDFSSTAEGHHWNWGSEPTPYTSIDPIAWVADNVNTNPTPYTSTPDPSWVETPQQGCDNGMCKKYTINDFTPGTEANPRGFFVEVEKGTVTLAGATLENYITGPSVKWTAPVVAKGGNFNIEGGKIQHNKVAYNADDNNNKQNDAWIEKYIQGKYINPPRGNALERTETAGAVIYMNGAKGTISGGTIENNRGDVGGIAVRGAGTKVTIKDNGEINKNVGIHYGGAAVVLEGGSLYMTGGAMKGNYAWDRGGAVYVSSQTYETSVKWPRPKPAVTGKSVFVMEGNGVLENNYAVNRGGGIFVESNDVILKSGTIQNNYCRSTGGGIYVEGDGAERMYQLYIPSACITGNSAVSDGKDAALDKLLNAVGDATCDFENTLRSENAPVNGNHRGFGGGLYLCAFGGNATFGSDLDNKMNVVFKGNSADSGRGQDMHLRPTRPGAGSAINMLNNYAQEGKLYNEKDNKVIEFNKVYPGALSIKADASQTCDGCTLTISGNIASVGAGISSNGTVIFGPAKDIYRVHTELQVEKDWSEIPAEERKEIKLQLAVNDGGKITNLDGYSVVLNGTADTYVGGSDNNNENEAPAEGSNQYNDASVAKEIESWKAQFGMPLTYMDNGVAKPTILFDINGQSKDPSKTDDLPAIYDAITGGKNVTIHPSSPKLVVKESVKVDGQWKDSGEYTYTEADLSFDLTASKKDSGVLSTANYQDQSGEVTATVNTKKISLKFQKGVKNEKPVEEVPAPEKYINNKVHQSLEFFDKPFEYSIMVFVPKNATEITITDTLEDPLMFVEYYKENETPQRQFVLNDAGELVYNEKFSTNRVVTNGSQTGYQLIILEENDHDGSGSGSVSKRTDITGPYNLNGPIVRNTIKIGKVDGEGNFTEDKTGNTIQVTISDAMLKGTDSNRTDQKDAHGKWVLLTFHAAYKDNFFDQEKVGADDSWLTDDVNKGPYEVYSRGNDRPVVLEYNGQYFVSSGADRGKKWEPADDEWINDVKAGKINKIDKSVITGYEGLPNLGYDGTVKNGQDTESGKHHGTLNQATYTVTAGNKPASEYKTNIVTVEAPMVKYQADKKWLHQNGNEYKERGNKIWPKNLSGQPAKVTFTLWKVPTTEGNGEATQVGEAQTITDFKTVTFAEQPKLKNFNYEIREEVEVVASKFISDDVTEANGTIKHLFTNKLSDEPEVEKYVNNKVHANLENFDEVFEYSIMAYVPSDAKELTITDQLEGDLLFVDADGKVQGEEGFNPMKVVVNQKGFHGLVIEGATNNHNGNGTSGTVTGHNKPWFDQNPGYLLTDVIAANGEDIIDLNSKTITVKITQEMMDNHAKASYTGQQGYDMRGKNVILSFKAVIDPASYGKVAEQIAKTEANSGTVDGLNWQKVTNDKASLDNNDNGTSHSEINNGQDVESDKSHTGLANKANYKVTTTSGGNYDYDTNTVTVKPKTTEIQIQKTWAIDGKDEWPDNTTVTFGVFQTKNGQETKVQGTVDAAGKYAAGTGDLTVELTKAKKNLTISNLPMLTGVTYSAREIAVSVNGKSTAVAYNNGGKAGQMVTDALTYIVKMLTENNDSLAKYIATNSKPAVEKYVEKKVHAELETFDTGFEYDIMAYVPAGATAIEIYDTLKPQLVLKSTADEIKASVVYKASNDHTVEGSVKATGTSVPEANIKVTIDPTNPNKVTVRVEKLGTEDGKLNLEGQWVQVTLKAEISDTAYMAVAEKINTNPEVADESLNWAHVTQNDPVLDGDATHDGLVNKASYKIQLDNIYTSEFETNEVTVKPKTVDLKITKRWENDTPAFRNGKEAEFKAALKVQSVKGEAVTDLDPQPTPTITKNDDNTWTVEWKGLINLDGVTYQVVESQIPGYNAPTGSPAKNGETITNTKPEDEIPEIEKYVEKDVHADLVYYDKEFVYDIIAYVPNDATSITITDKLDAKLTFVSTQAEIAASAVAIAKSNHKATSVTVAEGEERSVEETGTMITATAAIEGQNLTVTVANIGTEDGKQNIGGKSVRITFTAKIKANEDGSYTLLKGTDLEKVTEDTPVLSQLNLESGNKAGNHSGIKNQAKYTITTENDAAGSPKYPETPSNEVTVVPETEDLLVNKKWIGKEGTADQLKKALKLYANEADVTTLYASHATISKDKAEWKDLPKLQGVIYSVKEDTISGYVAPTYKNTDEAVTDKALNDGTITNKVIVEDISIIIEGDKVLLNAAGNTTQKTLKAGDFSFALYKVDGGADAAVAAGAEPLEVVTNDADGKFTFAAISYKEEDAGKSFYYVVKELVGSDETITLTTPESNEYRVTVTVSQEDGVLKTNLTENKVNVGTFTNTYTQPEAEPIALTITASKKLENATLQDDMFTFELREGDTLLESVTNKGEKVTFKAINYASAGEHTYTITEKKETLAGISYDGSTKTVTVKVGLNEDDPNNKFLYLDDVAENTVDAGTFTNVKGQVEKYVNKDVDATLKNPKEVFTFDVMGYVASNATKVTITDTLVNALEFVDADGKVTTDGKAAVLLVQAQASNNSTVNGTVANAGTKIDTFEAAISGQKLTVTITDEAELAKLQGKWVQLTFGARIKSDYANEAAVKADLDFKLVDDNKTVQGGAASHDGLTNKAEYEVELPNNGKVTDESNTVTVEPTYTKIQVEKKWQDAAGTDLEAADIPVPEVTVKLLADGDDTGKTLTLKASENWKGEVEGLPEYPLNENGQVSKEAQPIVYSIEETTVIDGFTSTVDGTTLINKKGEQPEIEKYVNQDVHKDVKINETFTYDIIAYVTKDATKLTIGDTLIKNLEFVSTKDDVKVVDLGEENNHKTNSAYSGENADATVAKAGTAVEATVTIDSSSKKLEVVVDNVEAKGLRGHYVKVSFQAKLSADAEYVEVKAADNKPVESNKDHTGVDNQASYVVDTDHGPYNELETNVVTVKPEKTSIKVNKEWKINGAASAWPAGATVEVKLQKTEGETTTDVKDAEDKAITATLTATKTEHSFTDLLVIEGVTYSVKEGDVTGADDFTKGKATKNADGSYTITNTLGEQPEIEKYINQNVHEFIGLDDEFTYDIIAYVTKDADKVIITDELNEQLQFVGQATDVKVYDLGTTNNHNTADKAQEEGGTATVATGTAITTATVTIDGQKLEVVIDNQVTVDKDAGTITRAKDDVTKLRGHYVRVEFKAVLKDEAKADLSKLALETIKDNAPLNVTDAQKEHEGVANKASYQIEVGNEGKYEDESNTVTVKPEEPEIEKYVNKKSATGAAKDGGVHTDLAAFDEVYTYDIQAYIAKDATVAEITDELVKVLEFVGDGPTAVVIKAGEDDGKAPKLSKAGVAPEDAFSIDAAAWKEGKLVLTLGKADSTEVLKAAGQWIQITFEAKIKDTFKSIDALKNAGADVWTTVVENDPIDDAKVDDDFSGAAVEKHEGIANDASYKMKKAGVDVGNTWSYNDKSNTVTVQPKTTELTVSKEWKTGTLVDQWPEGAEVEVKLTQTKDGVTTDVEGKIDKLTADKQSVTFADLPCLEGVTYGVAEGTVTNAGEYKIGNVKKVSEGVFQITNQREEEPEIEKYVNKKSTTGTAKDGGVHTDLAAFDEVYTYDIQAYIAKDATVAEITDELVKVLEFVGDGPTAVVIKAGEDDGKAPKLSKAGAAPEDAFSIDAAAWKDGKLVLTLGNTDSTNVLKAAGQWIQITFDAKIKDDYRSIAALKSAGADVWVTETENTPIDDAKVDDDFSGAAVEKHEGIANDASYKMKKAGVDVGNTWTYNDDSNTVTVQPKTLDITVNKEWKIGTAAKEWPAGASVKVQLQFGGENLGQAVELTASKTSHIWTNLPKYEAADKQYTVVETEVDVPYNKFVALNGEGVVSAGDKEGTFTVTNQLKEKFEVKINKTDLGGEELDGAKIAVTSKETGKSATWTSKKGETFDLYLEPGQYSFVETSAPDGYQRVTSTIEFTVSDKGEVSLTAIVVEPAGAVEIKNGVIVLKDALKEYPVKLNKTDLGGTELDGAVIIIKDADSNEIDRWTSKEGEVKEMMLVPGDYTFKEESAPDGYQCVTTEIGFTVNKDGSVVVTTVVVEPAGAVEVVDGMLILKDALKPEEPTTTVSEEEEEPSTEPDGGGTLPPGGDEDSTTVNAETDVPEPTTTEEPATLPPYEEGETTTVNAETEVPTPDTGDHSNVGLYIGLMGAAALGGVVLLLTTRKKKEEE